MQLILWKEDVVKHATQNPSLFGKVIGAVDRLMDAVYPEGWHVVCVEGGITPFNDQRDGQTVLTWANDELVEAHRLGVLDTDEEHMILVGCLMDVGTNFGFTQNVYYNDVLNTVVIEEC